MRSLLFMVLAFWVLCECRAWSGQGMREEAMRQQGMSFFDVVDMIEEASPPLLEVVDGTAAGKLANIVQYVVRTLPHDKKWEGKGHMFSDGTAVNKQVHSVRHVAIRRSLHDRHVVHMSSDNKRGMASLGGMSSLDVVNETAADKHVVDMLLHAVRLSLPHDSGLGLERHVSLLDVIDGTAADRQANAVRRQGVDSALLGYAGLALPADARTGVIYYVGLPPSLSGIQAQATRLIPASFKQGGVTFNEFTLPMSASFVPPSAFVTLVYRKISTFVVYTLPPQYQFGGPVVGIISSPSNSTSVDPSLPQASISLPPNTFIKITLPMFSSNPNSLCAFFSSNGSIFVSNLASSPNVCLSSTLGDFALVVQTSSTPSSTQNASPPASAANGDAPLLSSSNMKHTKNWRLIVGVTFIVLAGLALLVAIAFISIKLANSVKLFFTTRFTGNEEALQNSLVGGSIAPAAAVMRTKPALEIDMAHFAHRLNA